MTLCAATSIDDIAAPPLAALRAKALCKTIDDRRILDGLSFEVPAGRSVALLGANGAGKSTLLRILAGLVPPTSGELSVFDTPHARGAAAIRARIGMVGHASMMYRELTAFENLVFFARLHGVARPKQRAHQLLEEVGLSDRRDDPLKTYSRGMTQRAAIARALIHDPDLLLADEPFTGLDPPSCHALERMLEQLHRQGKTIILAHHDIERSLHLAERVLVLRGGRLVQDRASRSIDAASILEELTGG